LEQVEPTVRGVFDDKAAKAAVEADGYKRVSILGKGPGGTWRATGFRSTTTEIQLNVDAAGTVTTD
jgi:hypothetical protein